MAIPDLRAPLFLTLEAALLAASHEADAWVSLTSLFERAHLTLDVATRSLVVDMLHRRVLLEWTVKGYPLYRAFGEPR